MGTKTFNNYEDLLTFTRASGGHALRPVSYGSEEVANGTFDSDISGWTTGGNVTSAYSSGAAQLTLGGVLTASSANWFSQSVFEVGKIYFVTFDATYVSGGSLQAGYGFELEATATSSGTYSFTVDPTVGAGTQTNRNNITFGGTSGAVWKIDNVSVKEVTFDKSDGTLTLFSHPENIPRVEWDAQRNRLGLLVEESRTNLLKYSEDQTAVNWGNINVQNQTSPSATGPDGAQTATEIIANDQSGNPSGDDYQAYVPYASIITTANTDYTISVFVKRPSGANAPSYLYIHHDVGINGGVWFDLVNGTVATERTGFTGAIEDKGNGWYRCACSFNSGSDTFMQANFFFTENDASQLMSCLGQSLGFLYGAQFEEGSFATSYIKTTGATATRSADVASIPVADFGYNQGVGSLFVRATYINTPTGSLGRYLELNGPNAATDRILIYVDSDGDNQQQIRNGGVDQSVFTYSNDFNVDSKVATGFKKNSTIFSVNGTNSSEDTSVTVPDNIDTLDIGRCSSDVNAVGQVYIHSIKYYPRRLTNAQLQDLTT